MKPRRAMGLAQVIGLAACAYLMLTNVPGSFWFCWGVVFTVLNLPVERLFPAFDKGTPVLVDWEFRVWEAEYLHRRGIFGFHEVRNRDGRVIPVRTRELSRAVDR